MKILQTPPRFYPSVGGVENYVYNLSRELVKLGHDVKVLCAADPAGSNEVHGIKVKRLFYSFKIANTNITPSMLLYLLKEDYDVIHTHLPTPWSADWSALASTLKRKPLVLTYHNDIVGKSFANYLARAYNMTSLKFLLKKAMMIIISHSSYLEFSPYLRGYQKKIKIIPPGVDIERFRPIKTNGENTIFFLSVLDEFHKYKGLDYLLNALRLVKKEVPMVKLRIGGGGASLEHYKKKATTLGLEENVDFLGPLQWDEIPKYYQNCNLFVLPSISAAQEGFGMVLLEALASGKPVVSTSIVGIAKEVIESRAGEIVKPRDTKALAEAIIALLQDDKKAKRMGTNGRTLVEKKYSWAKIALTFEKLYNSLEP